MEPLTWFGTAGTILAWPTYFVILAIIVSVGAILMLGAVSTVVGLSAGSVAARPWDRAFEAVGSGLRIALGLFLLIVAIFCVLSLFMSIENRGIAGNIFVRFLPVWVSMAAIFTLSILFKRSLGLYGRIFDSTVGMIGFGIVLFWVLTAFFGGAFELIVTHDALTQVSGMKNKVPGTPMRGAELGDYQWYLLGGDTLARDVFSRMIYGAAIVLSIAPLATLFGYIVGITLGLPAGYYGGRLDTILSFLANLILAFPVILLFYLLVTPEIVQTGIPMYMAAVFFIFPIVFLSVLIQSRFHVRPQLRNILIGILLFFGIWLYLSTISDSVRIEKDQAVPGVDFFPPELDLYNIDPGVLTVFIAVVFVNSPTIFRIMRGLTLDVKTRDYVAAAQTRGETAWYIMLWEILPNVRGPLIVDFCLRIGYATILLGTLGFFGLGLEPESPDWGTTINTGRKLLSVYLAPVLTPALSLLSLVLGLNLLADGLREESLKD